MVTWKIIGSAFVQVQIVYKHLFRRIYKRFINLYTLRFEIDVLDARCVAARRRRWPARTTARRREGLSRILNSKNKNLQIFKNFL